MRAMFSSQLRTTLMAIALGVFFHGCGQRNQTLKIGDQDILALGPQDECNYMMNQGLRVSWKSSTPVRIVIHKSVPARFDAAIVSAANRWNEAFGRALLEVSRDDGAGGPTRSDRVNGIYWMTDWEPAEANKQAWTWASWEISKIHDADIRVNAKDHEYYVDGDVGISLGEKVHFESLIVHELGHVLGLYHNDSKTSVMQTTLGSAEARAAPSAMDVDNLRCEY